VTRTVHLEVEVEIRPAVERDLPGLSTWSGLVEDVFRPALGAPDRVLLVALARGRFPIGHALIDLHGIISHLIVLAGFRDQGIGTAFLAEAVSLIKQAGGGHATLMVEKTNPAAIRLYERLGFKTTGESSERWNEPMPDGTMQPVDHPSWVMRKEL
jgi:ribosomal protein S18 acetylase RimI-like enzyme